VYRKNYNICLCYHGFSTTNNGKATFTSHRDEVKEQIKYLQEQGYVFVWPSEYKDWYKGDYNPTTPIACITIDDTLSSVSNIEPWFRENNIKYSIAVIARRLRKLSPESGFLSWSQLKTYYDSGLCELLHHTYNLHNLAIGYNEDTGELDGAPPMDGPVWVDNGQLIYSTTGSGIYYSYEYVDTDSWSFPLFGSDPGEDFKSLITSNVFFRSEITGQITALRLWAAGHSYPSSSTKNRSYGYPVNIKVYVDDVEKADTTIGLDQYETRAQWPEREFVTVAIDTPFNVVSGTNYKLTFETQNIGDGCFNIFAQHDVQDTDYYLNSNCTSLVHNDVTIRNIDFPPGYDWPARAGIILSTGGYVSSDTDYSNYISDDFNKFAGAINNYSNATWTAHSTGYIEGNEDPNLEVMVFGGDYGDGTLVDTKFKIDVTEEFTAELFRLKYPSNIGTYYPIVVSVSISGTGFSSWTHIQDFIPNWYDYHWQEVNIDTPITIPIGSYWIRFETKNNSPTGAVGLVRMFMDQEVVPSPIWLYLQPEMLEKIQSGELGERQHNGHYYDAFEYWWIPDYTYIPNYTVISTDYTDVFPLDTIMYDMYYDSHTSQYINEGFYHTYTLGGPGKPFFEFMSYTSGSGIPQPTVMAYPFGSYYNNGEGSTIWKSREDINTTLKTVMNNYGMTSGLTIYPTRVEQESVHREPDLRYTEYVLPRVMLYGNLSQDVCLNHIKAYTGRLYQHVQHGGVGWQVAFEPDPFGNALIRHSTQALDHVCFDAWFFGVSGTINKSIIADGGIYYDITDRNGNFLEGETITEADSSATAEVVWATNNSSSDILKLTNISGTWSGNKTITGNLSGATAMGDPEGPLEYEDDVGYCNDRGIKTYLILSNYNSDPLVDDVDPNIARYVLEHQNEYISQVADICLNGRWSGIQINLEGVPEDLRSEANTFFKDLSRELHSVGKLISTTAPAKTGTSYDQTSWTDWCDFGYIIKYVDFMKIMSYTESGDWSEPGAHAPDWFWKAVYDYTSSVVPIRFYPRLYVGSTNACDIWTTGADTIYDSYHTALANAFVYGGKITQRDHEGYWYTNNKSCYFGSPVSIKRAVDEAKNRGFGGVGIWDGEKGDIYEQWPTYYTLRSDYNMSFVNIQFPTDISVNCVGGPTYYTDVVKVASGHEKRNQRWSAPLCEYEVGYLNNKAQLDTLISFFRARKGKAVGFRFKDWSDYSSTASVLGYGNGTTTNYQLTKTYTSGGASEVRNITRPVVGTVTAYVDTVASGVVVDYETGIISFTNPPASGTQITASYEFDVPVRFNSDEMKLQMRTEDVGAWTGITLTEIRE
jgi:uncharacterized protein (TIGR02217 family)